jgi:hypothetical protein
MGTLNGESRRVGGATLGTLEQNIFQSGGEKVTAWRASQKPKLFRYMPIRAGGRPSDALRLRRAPKVRADIPR